MMFAGILKSLRESNNMTQVDLAKHLNITDRNIRFYESGQRIPPADILIKISDYFDVSIDYLLGRTNIKKPMEFMVCETQQGHYNGKKSINAKDLSPESQEDLKKYIELLKIKDMQQRNKDTEFADDMSE